MSSDGRVTKTQEMVYEMKVRDVMVRDIITVGPQDRMSKLRGILHKNRISGLPVVDGEKLLGIISIEDFIKWLADRHEDCPIEERMTRQLETVHDDDPLVLAIDKFEKTGLGRLPVVSRDGTRLTGILTKGNVIEGLLKKLEIDYHEEEIHHYRASHIFEDIEADDTTLMFQYYVKGHDFDRAGESSTRLKRTLKRLGVRPDLVRRVAIASYEAEMNQVVFTDGGMIRARVQPSRVFLEAEDLGPGIEDIEKALQPGYSTAPEWVRELGFGAGMGLCNIQKSSDTFDIQSAPGKGTLLKVSFCSNGETHETG
ncbi:MAG TPA: CBS domain-containing protein [Thermoguttaceae bacterium]|nr:CBS domain-containing protein [Thermoguttaceae bacterium]